MNFKRNLSGQQKNEASVLRSRVKRDVSKCINIDFWNNKIELNLQCPNIIFFSAADNPSVLQSVFTITEKAPTKALVVVKPMDRLQL